MALAITEKERLLIIARLGAAIGGSEEPEARLVDLIILIRHIEALEDLLDEADQEDTFGTQGWRYRAGIGQ